MRWCDGILLESAGVVVSAYLAIDARSVYTSKTGRTITAGGGHPFDADAVTYFEVGGFSAWTE